MGGVKNEWHLELSMAHSRLLVCRGRCFFVLGNLGIPGRGNNTHKGPGAFQAGRFFRFLEEACESLGQALDGKMRTYADLDAAPITQLVIS